MELTLLVFCFIGFAGGFALAYLIDLGATADAEAHARYWRKVSFDLQAKLNAKDKK